MNKLACLFIAISISVFPIYAEELQTQKKLESAKSDS